MVPTHSQRTRICFALITAGSISLAYLLYASGLHEILGDAYEYYDFARQILAHGLFDASSELRTFAYPLFIAFFLQLGFDLSNLQFVVFNVQLAFLLLVCYYAAKLAGSLFRSDYFAVAVYAITALNPILLVHTREVLTDLPSAVLVFFAILIAVHPRPPKNSIILLALASFFIAGLAATVRPANIALVPIVILLWLLRAAVRHNVTPWVILVAGVSLAVPFAPQLINNYRAYHQVQPLVVSNLAADQAAWGVRYLKYATAIVPGIKPPLYYYNPLVCPVPKTPADLALGQPLGFALTLGAHVFGLFDQDLLFVYVTDLNPWYRWPLAILNDTFLFFSIYGVARWLRRTVIRRRLDRSTLFFGGLLAAAIGYVAMYAFTAVENRFSLPVYLWLGPFAVYGAVGMRNACRQRRWRRIAGSALALGASIAVGALVSGWLWLQSPTLSGTWPVLCCTPVDHALDLRFENGTRVTGYSITDLNQDDARIDVRRSGGPLDKEQYTVRAELTDSEGHVWSHGILEVAKPCSADVCKRVPQTTDSFRLPLPPTMPGGEYGIRLSLYDVRNQRTANAIDAEGKALGDDPRVATVTTSKNKRSVAASELPIEQRLFVDMREIRFLGYVPPRETLAPGESLDLGLYWRARAKPAGDYAVVIRLIDASGQLALEQVSRPAGNTYPTSLWSVGEVLLDWHRLTLPESFPEGMYTIHVLLVDAQGTSLGEATLPSITVVH